MTIIEILLKFLRSGLKKLISFVFYSRSIMIDYKDKVVINKIVSVVIDREIIID